MVKMMKPRTTSRYAVFLILLVLGQEFCVARYASQSQLRSTIEKREEDENKYEEKNSGIAKRTLKKQEEERDENKYEEKREYNAIKKRILKKQEDEHKYEEKTVRNAIAKRTRKKRSVGHIISVISIALMTVAFNVQLMGIGLEVYMKIEECCGLYPSACEARDEFLKINKTIIYPIAKEIHNLALKAKLFKNNVIKANEILDRILTNMDRIGEYELEIFKTLPNKTIVQIETKMHEIEVDMMKHNLTMQTLKSLDIDTKFKSYFDDAGSAMIGLLPLIGNIGTQIILFAVKKIFKKYALRRVSPQPSTERSFELKKILGKGISDAVTMDTTATRTKMKTQRIQMAANIVGAGFSLFVIGFDIYGAIKKVLQCKKVRDKVKKARDSIETAADEMVRTKAEVQGYYNILNNEGWKVITNQLTNDTFLDSLREMKLLAEGAAVQSQELKSAAKTLQHFLENINGSKDDAGTVINLQKDLVKALGSIKFLLKCFYNRLKLIAYVERECKKGHESLSKIFKHAKSSFNVRHGHCKSKGIPYATPSSLRKANKKKAEEEGWNLDCKLNNNVTANTVCRKYKCDKKKASTVAQEMGLTVDQVNYFLLQNCSNVVRDTLTPAEESMICTLRNSLRGILPTDKVNGIIKSSLGECVKPSAINDYKCPTKARTISNI